MLLFLFVGLLLLRFAERQLFALLFQPTREEATILDSNGNRVGAWRQRVER